MDQPVDHRVGLDAAAIMDRTVHGTIWVETGEVNMRAKLAAKKK